MWDFDDRRAQNLIGRHALSRRQFLLMTGAAAWTMTSGCETATAPAPALIPLPRSPGGRLSVSPKLPTRSISKGLQPLGLQSPRDGRIYVPSSYSPGNPLPLLVLFHGKAGASDNWFGSYGDRAEAAGIVMLAVDSRGSDWDLVTGGSYAADLAFLDLALAEVFDRVAIDATRIGIAGFSTGASYSLGVGLTNGDFFSRVVAYTPLEMSGVDAHGTPGVFVSHGRQDAVPIDLSSRPFVNALRAAGYDVEFVEFDGGHSVPQRISDRAFEWLVAGWSR